MKFTALPTADEYAVIREAYAETYPVRPLLNAIDALQAADRWRPIETAPSDVDCLVWLRGNRTGQFNDRAAVCRRGFDGWSFPGIGGLRASHWKPAPGSPDNGSPTTGEHQ